MFADNKEAVVNHGHKLLKVKLYSSCLMLSYFDGHVVCIICIMVVLNSLLKGKCHNGRGYDLNCVCTFDG